jgi:hypothetical protein
MTTSVLLACGGGGGGADIAGGQGPDPVVLDVPIAYVKRPLPADDQGALTGSDARQLRTFNIGADLYVRDRASPSAPERNITGAMTQGLYDVRDLEVSWDATKILFAMRGPFMEGVDEQDQPTWNIWEYDLANDVLRRVIVSDTTAEAGHDVAPHYLPDGRIIFSSTRQRQSGAILVDEGKPQFPGLDEDFNEPAFVLHVMNADGSDIHQVSFNQSHDLDPTVLESGEVVFTRWDNAGGVNEMSLYRMNPDGTDLQLLYGANSHDTGTAGATVQFLQPRERPDHRLVSVLRPFTTDEHGGDLVLIDTPQYVENTQPLAADIGILTGPAQTAATVNDGRTDGSISPGGNFSAVFPLWDGTNRMLVSWSQCRLLDDGNIVPCTAAGLADANAEPAAPLYGIWIYDLTDDTQLPVLAPEEGFMYTDIVAAQVRALPAVIYDQESTGQLDPDLVAEGVGLLKIRSVYDVDGVDTASPDIATLADPAQTAPDERPARFLRLEKAVAIPGNQVLDFDDSAFGVGPGQGMREILGYTMVEPDGSVMVKVPANVPVAVSVLDRQGRRITQRHQNWLQLRPGQVLECNGCHNAGSGVSHGREGVFHSVWAGAPADGQPFPNTDPAIFADFGETMAEARARLSCATDCAAITPGVDVAFDDVWTNGAKEPGFAYRYADLATPPPTSTDCLAAWSPHCRIVINYETHIHPLWGLDRQADTCTACHNVVDGDGVPQVPSDQLDLSDGASAEEANHFKSYRELLFGDNEQEIVDGVLQDRLVQVGVDPVTGDPVFAPVPVAAVMSPAGALASAGFFDRFAAGGSHAGRLTEAELRLIAEWLDIGAQYFNNPFDAPLN